MKSMTAIFSLFALWSLQGLAGYSPGSLRYLGPQSIDTLQFNPPLNGSPADKEDLDLVLKRTRSASPQDCERARSQTNPDVASVFSEYLRSKKLNKQKISLINNFFSEHMWVEVDFFVHVIKERTNRERPFQRDKQIQAHQAQCMQTHPSASYLSGHSALARAGAHLLNQIFPSDKNELFKMAATAADNRVLAGLHHYSDTNDGAKLADLVFEKLEKNATFVNHLNELKKQILDINFLDKKR